MSAQCRPRKLICDARLGFLEAVLSESHRQFLIGHVGAFDLRLDKQANAILPTLISIDLDNVEATLRLFAPTIDMTAFGARRVPTAHHASRGEVSRIVLEALLCAALQRPL